MLHIMDLCRYHQAVRNASTSYGSILPPGALVWYGQHMSCAAHLRVLDILLSQLTLPDWRTFDAMTPLRAWELAHPMVFI